MSGPFGSSQWMYKSGDYEIANSLRFEDGDAAYLQQTPSSAGNRRTWTLSWWVKRSSMIDQRTQFAGSLSGSETNGLMIQFDGTIQNLMVANYRAGYNVDWIVKTDNGHRDPSDWYHCVVALDTTQGTDTNRIKIYLNGVLQGLNSTTYPDENFESMWNQGELQVIGISTTNESVNASQAFDGYMAEVNFIDGTALDASYFGETGDYGEWKPKKYSGAYGNEGFYLDFKSSGVGTAGATTIGADRSGNGNHWTSTNVAVTDQMPDTPTNNFCTVNPIDGQTANKLKEGSLQLEPGNNRSRGTFAVTTGKWYFELLLKDQSNSNVQVGIAGVVHNIAGDTANEFVRINHPSSNGNGVILKLGGTDTDNLGAVVNGDIIGVAFDMDAEEISFLENNTAINAATTDVDFSGLTNKDMMAPHFVNQNGRRSVVNFGQDSSFAGNKTAQGNQDGNGFGDFYYAPPSGYLALCSKNLPDCAVVPSGHFSISTWTGDGSEQAITGAGFQPDWVWLKNTTSSVSSGIYDAIRGATKEIDSDSVASETTLAQGLKSFDTDGYTLGTDTSVGENTAGFVGYNWLAGGGAGSSNTDGSINTGSTSVNVDGKFSISTYTGNATEGATVGHGLGVAPELIMVSNVDTNGGWSIYHTAWGETKVGPLQSNEAINTSANIWNNTAPGTSVFTIGNNAAINGNNQTFVAYSFASVPGYSKIGSYVGNGATDGPFVNTGFRPRWVIVKAITLYQNYLIRDTARDINNPLDDGYRADLPNAQNANTAEYRVDYVSNGFKVRHADDVQNDGDVLFAYWAFAETPFKHANAR